MSEHILKRHNKILLLYHLVCPVEKVISAVKNMNIKTHLGRRIKKSLIAYYRANACRMLYKTYRQNGLLIGSGAMETAHRHVVQHRMKLSGQRWII